jgi:hypothetical protein
MKEMLGTSYLYCPRPYALEDVRIWYHRIATALGIDLSAETDSLATKAKSEMASLQAVLAGRSFGLRCVPGRPLAVAKFLVELGMKPLFIHTGGIVEQDKQEIRFILEKGFDPILVGGEDSMEIDRLLWSSRPDYLIAYNFRDIQPASQWGIKVGSIEPASAKLGYECSLEAARILVSVDAARDILFYKNQFFDAIEKD